MGFLPQVAEDQTFQVLCSLQKHDLQYIQAQMEMHQTLSDLHQQYLDGEFESEEAYNNAVTAAKEYYYELLEQYQDIYHNIFADNFCF